jgi:hypothetical protein
VDNFKGQIADIKTIAPYAAQVVTFVPGVGQGVGAAMAAATALASGQPLSAAVLNGIKGAIPGGQLAQSAFGAVQAVAAGKSHQRGRRWPRYRFPTRRKPRSKPRSTSRTSWARASESIRSFWIRR